MSSSIRVENLCAGYGAVQVLDRISLTVNDGETVALLGTNGNGKSTLMKCIMGIVRPTAGSIVAEIDGVRHDLVGLPTERIVDLGIAYDTFLSPSLTLHGRIEGIDGQGTGLVALFGIAHAFELGPVTLKFPANVAFITKNYYQNDEGGFGYASVGSVASIPISFIPEGYGAWTYNLGAYYYHTDTEVVGNRENNIVTATTGVALAF